jgi:hypothetical protein
MAGGMAAVVESACQSAALDWGGSPRWGYVMISSGKCDLFARSGTALGNAQIQIFRWKCGYRPVARNTRLVCGAVRAQEGARNRDAT